MPELKTGEHKIKGWGTLTEIDFIERNLGKIARECRDMDRAELLRLYVAGVKRRTDWAGMDRNRIIRAAESKLRTVVFKGV